MKIQRSVMVWCSGLSLSLLLLASSLTAEGPQGGKKYVCSETNPETMCSAATTCGSASAPCTVNVKRSANAASVTPDIPNAKSNKPFCVKVGTTVTWQSGAKNTGFVLDFGPSSPFDQGTIIGGSDRSVSVVAKKAGCYKFSAGACVSGSIYGMCGNADTEMIVIGGGN